MNIISFLLLVFGGWLAWENLSHQIKQLDKKMSAVKDTLDGINAHVAAIDEKLLALVAAAGNDNLAPETQAALDALVATVNKTATDAGVA